MIPLKKALTSSLGKKYVMGVTGLSLIGFMVTHLAANMMLYLPDPEPFNRYPHQLHSLGPGLWVLEIGLGALFVTHAAMAIWIWLDKRRSAGQYATERRSKGGNSRFNIASVNMIFTGLLLLFFLFIHIWMFRFGPGIEAGYVTTIDGEQARDLYGLVKHEFSNPINVVFYVTVMLIFGLHVRHGFWSAFQSLGLMKPEWSRGIYALGLLVAIIFAAGFLFIPIWMYFDLNLFAR